MSTVFLHYLTGKGLAEKPYHREPDAKYLWSNSFLVNVLVIYKKTLISSKDVQRK